MGSAAPPERPSCCGEPSGAPISALLSDSSHPWLKDLSSPRVAHPRGLEWVWELGIGNWELGLGWPLPPSPLAASDSGHDGCTFRDHLNPASAWQFSSPAVRATSAVTHASSSSAPESTS